MIAVVLVSIDINPPNPGASRIGHRKLLAVDKLLQAVPIPVPPLLSGGWVEFFCRFGGMWTSRHSTQHGIHDVEVDCPQICRRFVLLT